MSKFALTFGLVAALVSCGQSSVTDTNTSSPSSSGAQTPPPLSQAEQQKIIDNIEAKIASGELKPTLTITSKKEGINAQAGNYYCNVYNVVEGIGWGLINGHAYASCNINMPYLGLSGYMNDTSIGTYSPTAQDERLNYSRTLLLQLNGIAYVQGHRYCAISMITALFPGDSQLSVKMGPPGCAG